MLSGASLVEILDISTELQFELAPNLLIHYKLGIIVNITSTELK